MLGLRDSLTLATTKLKVRRVRLVVTLIVAGVLFAVLVMVSLVIRGSVGSLESFVNDGLLNRFITVVFRPPSYDTGSDKAFIERVEQLDKVRLAEEAQEAKRLGLPFEAATAPKGVSEFTNPAGKKEKVANLDQPTARQAYVEANPDTYGKDLAAMVEPYGSKGIYQSSALSSYGGNGYEFSVILNGKEQPRNMAAPAFGVRDAVASLPQSLQAFDNALLEPFVMEGSTLAAKAGEPLPVLAPVDGAEKLLGLKPLERKASATERLARLRELRSRAKSLTFEVCVRNVTASALRDKAQQQAEEIAAASGTAGYVKPQVVYAAPSSNCLPTAITSDGRSAAEKALATKREQFDEKFGVPAPVTKRIRFRVAGLLPQLGSLTEAQGPEVLISSFFTSSLGEGWFVSRQAALLEPQLASIINDSYLKASGVGGQFVEFGDRASQKRFLDDKACPPGDSGAAKDCAKNGKVMAIAYGNPLATLYDLKSGFDTFLTYALVGIAVLSAIVMMGTIGKIIADSRKETSVFRAVGAKRLDIGQIYLLYTVILASLSFLVAIGIGLVAAGVLEWLYSPGLSLQAVLAFNSHDLSKTFHLIGFNARDFGLIYGFVLAVSVVSACVPLASNLRRNPVKDMREE